MENMFYCINSKKLSNEYNCLGLSKSEYKKIEKNLKKKLLDIKSLIGYRLILRNDL